MIRVTALFIAATLCGVAHATGHVVNVGGNSPPAFVPQTLTVAPGDTVTFINKGGKHNVLADDGSFRCAHGCKGDAQGNSGAPDSSTWVVSLKFPNPGSVGYFCELHGAPGQGMYGTIVVQAPQVPATTPGIGAAVAVLLAAALALLALLRLRRN